MVAGNAVVDAAAVVFRYGNQCAAAVAGMHYGSGVPDWDSGAVGLRVSIFLSKGFCIGIPRSKSLREGTFIVIENG